MGIGLQVKKGNAMTARGDNRKTIERLITEVWNAKNLDVIEEVFAPDAQLHMAGNELEGHKAIRDNYIGKFLGGFPDLDIEIADLFADGDRVAIRLTGTGTHQGDYFGKAATGKTLNYAGVVIFRMADGRIAEVWGHSDAAQKISQF